MPVLIEQFLAMSVGFSARTLAGHYLETTHLAAITLVAYLMWLLYETFSVVGIGATAMIARFVGAGDFRAARLVTTQALLLGSLVACAVLTLMALFGEQMVGWLQLRGEAATYAVCYLRMILPIIPLITLDAIGIACLRATGDMITGLVIMAIVNVVNVGVSWILVVGAGPIPSFGWRGIPIGTVCGYLVGGSLILAVLWHGRSGLRIEWRWLWPDADIIRRLLWIGLPGGADTLSIVGCQLWFLSVINQLGPVATAAHGVALSIESLALLPGVAFQMAASTLTGQYLGARNHRMASRSVWTAFGLGGGLMMSCGVILFTQAPHLTPLLVRADQTEVIRLATPLLRTVSMATPALALILILTGALRGAGDTRWPLLFSIVGLLGVRIPAAYWLAFPQVHVPVFHLVVSGWGLGVLGTWYAMVSDLGIRASLILYRFSQGGWKRVRV
jgi:putative MATE family efflux protein